MVLPSCGKKTEDAAAQKKIVVGFAQLGAESGWRTANTKSIKSEAEKRGVELRFLDAQQKQENQIKALRTFIQQKVDIIAFAPIVDTGWQKVLEEIKAAGIPVVLTDRAVAVTDDSLYVTFIGSDFVEEGRRAAKWFIDNTKGDINIFELTGTPGASCATDRKKGFEDAIADHPRIKIIKSQTGMFKRSDGKAVMEAFLKTPDAARCNALYSHNDDMAIGAIQAIKAAGKKPGTEIKIVSVDGVKDAFDAIIAGELNCTVECNPLLGPNLFDIIEAVLAAQTLQTQAARHKLIKPEILKSLSTKAFTKRIVMKEEVFDKSNAKDRIGTRKY
ncbi:MAG: ABC transporter substrate-binding protein [Phycisphaerales bacterium]|nr:ABC transporter substrate-binding protein [Phycisphaerales bacterium]